MDKNSKKEGLFMGVFLRLVFIFLVVFAFFTFYSVARSMITGEENFIDSVTGLMGKKDNKKIEIDQIDRVNDDLEAVEIKKDEPVAEEESAVVKKTYDTSKEDRLAADKKIEEENKKRQRALDKEIEKNNKEAEEEIEKIQKEQLASQLIADKARYDSAMKSLESDCKDKVSSLEDDEQDDINELKAKLRGMGQDSSDCSESGTQCYNMIDGINDSYDSKISSVLSSCESKANSIEASRYW